MSSPTRTGKKQNERLIVWNSKMSNWIKKQNNDTFFKTNGTAQIGLKVKKKNKLNNYYKLLITLSVEAFNQIKNVNILTILCKSLFI